MKKNVNSSVGMSKSSYSSFYKNKGKKETSKLNEDILHNQMLES